MSITFNGVTSDAYKLYVELIPSVSVPVRKQQVFSVPGRSGDIVIPTDAFENVEQVYEVYCSGDRAGMPTPALVRSIARWLMAPGYHELTDSYDPDVYREAYCPGGIEFANTLQRFGRATLTFVCKPQKFLQAWAEPFDLDGASTLYNPGAGPAKPEIVLHGSGEDGSLIVNGYPLEITGEVDGLTLICEDMEALANGRYVNERISGIWPELPFGESLIRWTGAISSITIKPRFYDI